MKSKITILDGSCSTKEEYNNFIALRSSIIDNKYEDQEQLLKMYNDLPTMRD